MRVQEVPVPVVAGGTVRPVAEQGRCRLGSDRPPQEQEALQQEMRQWAGA